MIIDLNFIHRLSGSFLEEIYNQLLSVNNNIKITPENIINYIHQNEHLKYLMLNQINLNKK